MPIYKNDFDSLVLFVHIPKTGGTSIEAALEDYPSAFFNKYKGEFLVTPQHFTKENYKHFSIDSFSDSHFCIVRDPLDRMISEYRYRMGRSRFLYKLFDFSTFVSFLKRHGVESNYFDNHIRKQIDFIFDGVTIFRFESGFEVILKSIKEDYGFSNMRIFDLHKKKSVLLDVKKYDFVSDIVWDLYRDDYEFFGYERCSSCMRSNVSIRFLSYIKSYFWKLGYYISSKTGL